MDMPPKSAKELQEPEASDSSPSHSLSWSLVQRWPSGHPNMKHCFRYMCDFDRRIRGQYPTFSFLDGPLMEDMLHDGLTETVVIDPIRAVLFYGRHSMGEGLTTDKARDAAFLLTGAGMSAGKSAYLTADQMTIQEGRRAITQAISIC